MTVFQRTCTIHTKSTYTCFLLVAQITILRECCPALGATPADFELPKDVIAIRETAILRYEPTTGIGRMRSVTSLSCSKLFKLPRSYSQVLRSLSFKTLSLG